ncbi:methyltransferase, FkbM family [Rhizobium sp. RU20A]|uniref:FkbM family methyltransferase n=1 Tax=Rhizobium sp. RU20A TaxID=1907412 RepID=UPI00095750E5|nr:FkbM family methyltransferase [Rhizobium sp. RU20A]SIQ60026.1 methyltransferase, FkbM family [Rhizobium sp. RU20A]
MTKFVSDDGLIFDLGMNNGDDSAFYLERGLRVVALEANPSLCERAAGRFADAARTGRLTIINAAIWESSGEQTFYINLENDHWSSLDIGWASRNGSACKAVQVQCLTLPQLFSSHGVPFTLKIDVEGVDHMVLGQLHGLPLLPRFVSVEDCRFGYEYLESLARCGYDGFKLFDQSTVEGRIDSITGHRFPQGSSGPLGPDIEGDWLSYDAVVDVYSRTVRDRTGNRLAPRTQWWDIHCTKIS